MIQGAIFDMDGIVIDSEPIWRKAIPEVLADLKIHLNEIQAMQTTGLRVDEVVHYWYARYSMTKPPPETVVGKINDKVIEYIRKDGAIMEGLTGVIALFRKRAVPVALASSSHYTLIDAVIDTLDIRSHFDVIYSAEEEPYGKPHPGVFLTAARKLGVPPYACIAIEDSLAGTIAAKAARMMCIAKPEEYPGFHKGYYIADAIVESLTSVDENILKKIETERDLKGI